MKKLHIPTLVMHLLLLLLARLTLRDYPDFFLGCAIVVLILHLGWAIESKGNFLLAHGAGLGLYLLAKPLGLIFTGSGFSGMGGEFGWLLYGAALAVSLAVHCIVNLIRRLK